MADIYLDNSATTCPCPSAVREAERCLENYGNPSSLHKMGTLAKTMKDRAKDQLCRALGIKSIPFPTHEIVFTSCGTESNNMALWGVLNAKNYKFLPRIVTTDSEHPSILAVLSRMESEGRAETVRLSTKGGVIDKDELLNAVNERTILVSIMLVNNETGAVYPVKELFAAAKAKKADIITHSDMTQGFLKLKLAGGYASTGADLITVSGHKVHAPKGVGALAIHQSLIKSKRIVSLMQGGGQERDLRSGTENMMGICAFGGACEEGLAQLDAGIQKMQELSELIVSRISTQIKVNLPERRAPHILSLTLPGIKSQTMLNHLSSKGIYISSGSACSSHGGHKSYVLTSFGLTPERADCTVRVSLSRYTCREEVQEFIQSINRACEQLVRMG